MNNCGRAYEVSPLSSILENDLVRKILSNLPVKSLVQAKCVCKSWRSLIESDRHFMYLHLTRSKTRPSVLISSRVDSSQSATSFSSAYLFEVIDHGEAVYNVTASWAEPMLKPVNGLICFIRHLELEVLIYNLSTREQTPWIKSTTTIETKDMSWYRRQFYGFGFDPTTKEHKVLRVFMKKPPYQPATLRTTDHYRTDDDFCEVLTVGQNSWRRINKVPSHKVCHDAFYANGALYWLCNGGDQDNYPISDCIVVFDVGSEKFIRVIPIPNFIRHFRAPYLLNVDGRLALLRTTRTDDRENDMAIKMWILDDGDVSWIEETISLPYEEKPGWLFSVEAIEGTDLIVVQSKRKTMEAVLSVYYYDRKKKTWTAPPCGGLTVKNAPPCVGVGTLDRPFDRIPFNYNASYEISTFTESLFPVKNQQQQQRPSSLGVEYEAATVGSSTGIHMLLGA